MNTIEIYSCFQHSSLKKFLIPSSISIIFDILINSQTSLQRYFYIYLDKSLNKIIIYIQTISISTYFIRLQFMDIERTKPITKFTKKVIVSTEESLKYRQTLEEFEKLYRKCNEEFSSSQEDTYHLLSTKFIKEWKEFCENTQEQRSLPMPYNQDIIEPQTNFLKPGLVEHDDYQIVNVDIMKLFSQFKGTFIIRRARIVNGEKKVKIYLQKFKYCILSLQIVKKIMDNKIQSENIKDCFKVMEFSEEETIEQLTFYLKNNLKLDKLGTVRLWLANIQSDKLINEIKKKIVKTSNIYFWMDTKIKGLARLLQSNIKINELNMSQEEYFIVEQKHITKEWFLQTHTQQFCQGCNKLKQLKYQCSCKKVSYCTESCKQKDRMSHRRNCTKRDQQQINEKVSMIMTHGSMRGLTGLNNLGNTCFMNSCLQCLSNTVPLTEYFLNSSYQAQINRVNPIGTKGKLAKTYAKFIRSMWCGIQSIFSPYSLKSAVASINPLFQGYSQQDSQEFFSFIVDGLHEDLNRVKKKPLVEQIQSNNREDKIVAEESWIIHTKRNQSIITDLMTGQYRSKVTCPDCHNTSITFDPFITVTVPIAQQKNYQLEFFVIYSNFHQQSLKRTIKYRKQKLQEWQERASSQTDIEKKYISFYILTKKENIYKVGVTSFSQIMHKIEAQSHNLFLMELSPQQVDLADPIEVTTKCTKKNVYESLQNLWFKFPIIMERKNFTGLNTYKRILKFIYYEAYDNSSKYKANQKYEEYQQKMLQNRPFQLLINYKKVTKSIYNGIEVLFKQSLQFKDEDSIEKILQTIELSDMEIQARFTKDGIRNFSMDKLGTYKNEKINNYHNYNHDKEDAPITLQQCLDTLRQPQKLDVGNQWYCPHCKKHKRAEKELSLYKAPKILIIHLKRFKQKGHNRKQKNQTKVIFQKTMDFTPYLCDPTPMESYHDIIKQKSIYIQPSYQLHPTPEKAVYQLYAVSNHYGGMGGGHYTAYAKNGGKWYDFNDSSVRKCSQSSICSSAAYLLFYQRKQQANGKSSQ